MNNKERQIRIDENWRKYHVPGQKHDLLKKNAIFISTANSLKHELKKLEICYELKKLGSVFITEAEKRNSKPKRRVDIVDLSSGNEIEIETKSNVKKKDCITIYI